jgi:hypothetical protein
VIKNFLELRLIIAAIILKKQISAFKKTQQGIPAATNELKDSTLTFLIKDVHLRIIESKQVHHVRRLLKEPKIMS